MRKVFIGLLALSLSLFGLGLCLPQSTLAQTQVDPGDVSKLRELLRLLKLVNQQIQQGQPEQEISTLQKALLIAQRLSLKKQEAGILLSIGQTYYVIRQPQRALEYYTKALSIYSVVNNQEGKAQTLKEMGLSHSHIGIGQPQKALEYYTQALLNYRAINDRLGEAQTLNAIGNEYNNISQPQKALEYYTQALLNYRAITDRLGEAQILGSVGDTYRTFGQPQRALEYYTQALLNYRVINDRLREAQTLDVFGITYLTLNQPQKALEYFTQALSISKVINDGGGEARILNNIGNTYLTLGQPQKALECFTQSLLIHRQIGSRHRKSLQLYEIGISQSGEARILNNIGAAYSVINQPQKALEYHTQALSINKEIYDRQEETLTLNDIGRVYSGIDQPQKALEYYTPALLISREIQNRSSQAIILSNLSALERARGNLQVALTHIESAIKIIETIRTEIISQDFRTSYFASKQDYYDFYIDILMQLHKQKPSKGFNALALQASERARARSLLDLLNESQADIRQGVDPKLLEQEKNLQFQLNALEKRRIELYSKTPTKSQVDGFNQEYDTLLSQYQDLETKIRSNSPRYAALTQPQPLTVAELKQQVIDDNTVLLEYFLGKDRSYLWVVSKSEITSYELPKQSEIEAATQQFRKVMANSIAQPTAISEAGAYLTQMLIAPAAKQIGQKRLLIVSNGSLQYLPFAALPALSGSQFLLSEHEIINLPSASTLVTLRKELDKRKPAPKTVAVFADPVFSPTDGRVAQRKSRTPASKNPAQGNTSTEPFSIQILRDATQEAGVNFERLPGTRQEAKGILQFLPANMQTQALDFNANKTTVLNANLSQYRIIHFATHGILNTTRPELSAVVLSLVDPKGQPQNGFLRLNDIFNLNLSAELVVLSACQTGLGQNIRGEGLIGLTRGFMYAGTPRVLVSLWNVNDESTAVLMTHFYKAMLEQKLPPAAALRAAQLKMQLDPKWRSPYYWAAFTLQGEWK